VHLAVGKVSMESEMISDNIKAVMTEIKRKRPVDVKGEFIQTVSVSSTMGPGIWVAIKDQD